MRLQTIRFTNKSDEIVASITFDGDYNSITITLLPWLTPSMKSMKTWSQLYLDSIYRRTILINRDYNIFEHMRDIILFSSLPFTQDKQKWFENRIKYIVNQYKELAIRLVNESNKTLEVTDNNKKTVDEKNFEMSEFINEIATGKKPIKDRNVELVKEIKEYAKVYTYEDMARWIK